MKRVIEAGVLARTGINPRGTTGSQLAGELEEFVFEDEDEDFRWWKS